MSMTKFTLSRALGTGLASSLAVLASSSGALALDGEAFATRLETLFATFGMTVDLGPATAKGDKIVIEGLTARPTAEPATEAATLDTTLTFSGVVEGDGGGYRIASLTIPDIAYSDDEGGLSLTNIQFANLYVPGAAQPTATDLVQLLGDFSAGPMVISANGAEVVTIASITSVNSFLPEQGAEALEEVRSNLTMGGISIDLSSVPEGEGRAMVTALGIDAVNGEFTESMDWSLTDGALNLSEFSLDLEELGSLNVTFGLGGYTLALLNSIYEANTQIAAMNSEADADKRAAAEQALGMSLLAQLSVTSLSLRYEDDSLAEKLITMMATQQNIPPEAMREGLKVAAQQAIASLGIPQLLTVAADPIAEFLDEPESFTVSISPSRSVSLIEIVALAQTPALLLQTVELEVTANE